jgi:hypothetical protein
MKKFGLILSVVAVALLAFAGIARADSAFTAAMVDADNSTTGKTSFGLNQVPWLWASKTNADSELFHYLYTTWYIVNPDSTLNYKGYSIVDPTTQQNMWTSLGGFDWSTISGSTESWEAISTLSSVHPPVFDTQTQSFQCSGCSSDTQCVSFTRYVPEPISASLFLLGGPALGLRLFRRKKKA